MCIVLRIIQEVMVKLHWYLKKNFQAATMEGKSCEEGLPQNIDVVSEHSLSND